MFMQRQNVLSFRGSGCPAETSAKRPWESASPFAKERIAAHLSVLAMTRGVERIATRLSAVSPAGSVGASAPQRCPQDTRTAMTNRLVILNAERERIRNTLRGEMDCCTPYGVCNDEGGELTTAADYTASQRQKVYHRSNRFFDRLINKNRFIFLIPL